MSSYESLAENAKNPLTKRLLSIMIAKKTNLCVSIDVISPDDLLSIIHKVGPYVCIIKVHPSPTI
jgi:orotidine-5'-phosphate decarboxylase